MFLQLIQPVYNIIDAIAYFASAAVPLYFIIRSRGGVNNPMRGTMIILAGFVLAQGVYHTASVFELSLLSKVVLEPLSAAILVAAALAYFLMRKKLLKQRAHGQIRK